MIYFDNAATTPIHEEVKNEMIAAMQLFGNPSSTHQEGRKAKVLIEKSRKLIAKELNCLPSEVFFTSGGTESDNWALYSAIRDLGVQRIVTSRIEHHAVLHAAAFLAHQFGVELEFVNLLPNGDIDLQHLESLLALKKTTLVSLMHGNNEIGNVLDIQKVGEMCRSYNAYFHSDTVQTVGHYKMDLQQIPIDFLAASAHKFHGPKGVGFMFVRSGLKVKPMLFGGSQERGLRASTENVIEIAGLGKAFEIAYQNLESDAAHIRYLKYALISELYKRFPEVQVNGSSTGLYTVVNVSFPVSEKTDMLLFSLDIKGICVSGGSACQSGSNKGSHVIEELLKHQQAPTPQVPLRISFSKYNTKDEVFSFCDVLENVLN